MAAELYEHEPVFQEHLDRGLDLLLRKTGVDFRTILFADNDQLEDAAEQMGRMDRMLAAIFIIEYALAQLWRSWGVEPDVMIGHSMGENTAACLAGVLSYEDCLDLIVLRGQLFEDGAEGEFVYTGLDRESGNFY